MEAPEVKSPRRERRKVILAAIISLMAVLVLSSAYWFPWDIAGLRGGVVLLPRPDDYAMTLGYEHKGRAVRLNYLTVKDRRSFRDYNLGLLAGRPVQVKEFDY